MARRDRSRPRSPSPSPTPAGPPRTRPLGWFVAGLLLLGALGTAGWWWSRPPKFQLPAPSGDMNVLLVTIDTTRADMMSSYGGPVPTPNLDALAAHGARFTFAHAHAVVTLVSHTSILSGELPYEHHVRDNSGFRVQPGTPTIATRLKAAGFETGAFIGGYPLTKRFGLTPGFDTYDDQLPEEHGIGAFALPERRADEVVTRADDWIGHRSGRYFAWVHVFDPHAPYVPPEPYRSQFADHLYYGEIAYVDHALGALFATVATASRPTLVVVTADHGESLGEHGEMTHGMFAYEATLHIPLIIATITPGQAQAPAGVVVDAPATHIDLLPTILDAVGVPADPALKGASLREAIRTDKEPERPSYFESMTFNLTRGWAPLRGVLVGRTKYIDLPIPELYDLVPDPTEQTNLARTDPDRLPPFATHLKAFDVAAPNRPFVETPKISAALQSLGYASTRAAPRSTYTAQDDPKTLFPVDEEVHAAEDLYEKGHAAQAITRLSAVMASHPTLGDVAVYLAYAQWETGQVPAAIHTLETAIGHQVTDSNVLIRLGLYLAESHTDPTRAIQILQQLPETNVEALNALGVAYTDAGRGDDAMATFRRLLALDPTNGLALQNIASIEAHQAELFPAGDVRRIEGLKTAEATVREALEADPSLVDAYNTLGAILAETNRMPEAIENWKHAVQLDPHAYEAMDNLIGSLIELGRLDEARPYAQRFIAQAPPAAFAKDIADMRRRFGS